MVMLSQSSESTRVCLRDGTPYRTASGDREDEHAKAIRASPCLLARLLARRPVRRGARIALSLSAHQVADVL